MFRNLDSYAGIQYLGEPGITSYCVQAIVQLIHAGVCISHACILTAENRHAFVLHTGATDIIAVKSGFSSGYPGEGPKGLADALYLLDRHCEAIDEFYVNQAFMDRLDTSCLSNKDMEVLESSRPLRPQRWRDYIYHQYGQGDRDDSRLAHLFPTSVPFSILDPRLVDLAIRFEAKPDNVILKGYRRLEDLIRLRLGGSEESSSKLMSEAFLSNKGKGSTLHWPSMHATEQFGRAQLFLAAFQAFRNHRAHNEKREHLENDLRDFCCSTSSSCSNLRLSTEMRAMAPNDAGDQSQQLADQWLSALVRARFGQSVNSGLPNVGVQHGREAPPTVTWAVDETTT